MPRNEWFMWSDFIGLFVATGYVKDEMAQSLLLVGEPGTGKSALLSRFYEAPSVMLAMDATAEGLKQQAIPRAITGNKRHLLLPEMYKLMQRRGPTAENTIGVLTLLMSGELHVTYIGKDQMDKFPKLFQMGVIGAMPTKVFHDWSQTINNTGLLSRMVPIEFTLHPAMIAQVRVAIAMRDRRLLEPVRFPWPDQPVDVHYSGVKVAEAVLSLARKVGEDNRMVNLLVSLTRAACLLEREQRCTPRHVELVAQFAPLFRSGRQQS